MRSLAQVCLIQRDTYESPGGGADCVSEAADVCRRQTSAPRAPFITFLQSIVGAHFSVSHLFSLLRTLAERRRWSGVLKLAHVPPQGDVFPHLPPPTAPAPPSQQQGPVVALQAPYLMYWTLFKAALHHFNGDPFGIVF